MCDPNVSTSRRECTRGLAKYFAIIEMASSAAGGAGGAAREEDIVPLIPSSRRIWILKKLKQIQKQIIVLAEPARYATIAANKAAEDSKYIFEAFKQSDEKSNKKYSGTGLGLTISKRLCDILGAELTFKSKAGIGTIFDVLLKDLELSHSEIVSKQSTFHINEIQFKNQLLLIVDDSDSNIIIVKKQLLD